MKAAIRFLAPPCAFVVFAFLASRNDSDDLKTSQDTGIRQTAESPFPAHDPVGVTAALSRLEQNIFLSEAEPAPVHDAEGMDGWLDSVERNSSFPGGGMGAISNAMDWAEEAPEDMFAWLIRQDATFNNRSLSPASILFETWSEKSMSAALAAVPKIPDPNIRAQALASTLENLYPKDPQRALEILERNLDLFQPGSNGTQFSGYDGEAPTTCDMLLALPPGPGRTHLLAGLLPGLASSSTGGGEAKAIQVWKDASESLRRDLVAAGFDGNMGVSFEGLPEMMRERAETSGESETAAKFIRTQGGQWAEKDLPTAFQWTQSHLKGRERVEAGANLFKNAAAKDFDKALATWKELPEGFLKAKALAAIQQGTPAGREPDFKEVIESLSDEEREYLR